VEDEFNEKLLNIVDKVLKNAFGESAAFVIYSYLLVGHSLKREEIPEKLDSFAKGLEKFSAGAHVIEGLILKDLYSSFGLQLKSTEVSGNFVDCVLKLKEEIVPPFPLP